MQYINISKTLSSDRRINFWLQKNLIQIKPFNIIKKGEI